jgi:pimeloyl-ACP methyl ester carboxylesterase
MTETTSPTVVLVHGAFADAGSWAPVVERLQAAGVEAQALVNPLRGIAADAAYVASALAQIPGPVLAVGHSYGGAVLTNAATSADNVVGLVYVAAFAPDEGESLLEIEGGSRDSVLAAALRPAQYPTGSGTAVELYVDKDRFHEVFAADLSPEQAAVFAVSQRPVAEAAFAEKTGAPAWKRLPSWAVVATGDKAAGSDVLLAHARRAGADTVEVDGSHVIMLSKPDVVVETIMKALRSVAPDLARQRETARGRP